MRKKRVLFVTEASFLPTGYSVYSHEVLSRLNQHPELEVAELGCFATPDDPRLSNIKWKFYPNQPLASDTEAMKIFNSNVNNVHGEYSFNRVCLDFFPDFVMDIRDPWYFEFQERSAFRDYYNLCLMPTVDAKPQKSSWIDLFSSADAVFSYTEFGRDTMLSQSNSIKFEGIASPCASPTFCPLDKKKLRDEMGIKDDAIIVGTVMRNQTRKLYNDLCIAFRKFLNDHPEQTNVFLYLHTAYPDVGWDMVELVLEHGLANKTLFTYQCQECGNFSPSFFHDAATFCYNCKKPLSTLPKVSNKITIDDVGLNKIYNLFDVYIQWANSEGFGMPAVEAAWAGLPVVLVDYSAMSSIAENIDAIAIKPKAFYKEVQTGCMRAVPDNDELANVIFKLVSNESYRKNLAHTNMLKARQRYSWDNTAKVWADYFIKTPVKPFESSWGGLPRMHQPPQQIPMEIRNSPVSDQANWLFANVLGRPQDIGKSLWKKMVKDLTFNACLSFSVPGIYTNEFSMPDSQKKYEAFNIDKAFEIFYSMRKNTNDWEKIRFEQSKLFEGAK